ncbi:TNFAIP3-interacting protein 2 [Mactra antiquata]
MSDVVTGQHPVNIYPRSIANSSSSSLNPELERDHYREKVEHFRILVQKLQEENQSYKLKKESTETVYKLLQESKTETVALQKKCSFFDATIRTLQSRLEAHGLSADIRPHEGEQYIPAPSKTVLDNLTRENKRLRNLVKSKSGDPEEYAKLQQKFEETDRERSELQLYLGSQQAKYAELETVLRASDNDKDKTINELREQLNLVKRELTTRDTQCTELSEETRMLQSQLEDVAKQCQELAKRLQEKGQATDKLVQSTLKACKKDGSQTGVVEEVTSLKQRLKEITDMNKRWQEYNNQRDAYVKTLIAENNDLTKRLSETADSQIPSDVQVEMNKILDEARRLSRAVEEQKQIASRACSDRDKHKKELDGANKVIAALRKENQQLKQRRDTGNSDDCSETIDALKAQIRICTEDFESERKDRERAQSRIVRLENDISRLKKEIETVKRDPSRWEATPHTPYTDPFFHNNVTGSTTEGLAARGVSCVPEHSEERDIDRLNVIDSSGEKIESTKNISNLLNDKEQTFVINIQPQPYVNSDAKEINSYVPFSEPIPISSKNRSFSASPPKERSRVSPIRRGSPPNLSEPLLCPKCNKEFSSTEHPELLDHIDHCAN